MWNEVLWDFFLRAANNQESYSAKSGMQEGCGAISCVMLSISAEVAAPIWGQKLSCWRIICFFRRTRFSRFFKRLYVLHVRLGVDFRRFSWIISTNICRFKSWYALKCLPGRGRSFRSIFPPLSSNVTTQRRITRMSTVSSP